MSLIVSCLPHVVCIEPMMMKNISVPPSIFFFWNTIMILLFLNTNIVFWYIRKNPCNVYWAGCHRQLYNVEISNALCLIIMILCCKKGSLFCFDFSNFCHLLSCRDLWFCRWENKSHLVNHSKRKTLGSQWWNTQFSCIEMMIIIIDDA